MSIRVLSCMMFALLFVGCGTTADRSKVPMIQGKTIELHLASRTTHHWYAEASKQFASQKPEALDLPLHLDMHPDRFGFHNNQFGDYSFKFSIDPQGKVTGVEVVRTSPEAGNDFILASYGLTQWRFAPPMHAGVPTGYCCVLVTIEH